MSKILASTLIIVAILFTASSLWTTSRFKKLNIDVKDKVLNQSTHKGINMKT
jgi:hypothetical protein